ncbi:MAG: 4-(cytidine 5'-diphospho)-2-C-methyl-D-erythritol kinase [Chlamydiota bacterium]
MSKLRIFSPAKVNLFFQVLGKRSDGYHEIASVYQVIDLGDFLEFTPCFADRLTSSDPTLPLDRSNLVLQALTYLRKRIPHLPHFHVHLDKKIPLGSGLGGASSNAATTLWALNEWMGSPLSMQELAQIGGRIGADVPCFFSTGLAYCRGKGENVTSLERLFSFRSTLALSGILSSTPAVYRQLSAADYSTSLFPLEEFFSHPLYFNDLEKAAEGLQSKLSCYKKALIQGGFSTVSMSGSGSAYFCLGEGKSPSGVVMKPIQGIRREENGWYKESVR